MKPHKHADLIKAWADGAEVEWWDGFAWISCVQRNPPWDEKPAFMNGDHFNFRIKPEKKWYRVAEFFSINRLGKQIAVADCSAQENSWPAGGDFCRWITDRIYYE